MSASHRKDILSKYNNFFPSNWVPRVCERTEKHSDCFIVVISVSFMADQYFFLLYFTTQAVTTVTL